MLGRFRDELVLPHLDVLRHFSPLGAGPRWEREQPAAATCGAATCGAAGRVAEELPARDARPGGV